MVRGAIYGSVAAALAMALPTDAGPAVGLAFCGFAWMFVIVVAGPFLLLAAALLRPIQEKLRRLIPGRLFLPVAALSAVPFGLLICFGLMKMLGWADGLASPQQWIGPLRVGIAGGLGLGLGCLRDVPLHD